MARSCSWSASSASTWPPEPDRHSGRDLAGASELIATPANSPGGQTPAAVLVPLFQSVHAKPPHVVLTRRRADLRRHAGEISFPGGRQDPEDADLTETALREAEEEIGLTRDAVTLIGELPAISTFATNYLIHPFVGVIPAGQRWRLSPREVDAVLELPLDELHQSRTRTRLERRGISFETEAYILDGHLIWGATYRILAELVQRLQSSDGRPTLA
ncbi:MAG TPA: CoA pyrophosphatase [Solirubrobacteraceae bacterium]|jgi:8-oxo-dGTP pyrophosphatase MutT (NUDIX family)|nr:CoA pyrophosphatase [Solirubrobacteraceae bacterium]